MGHPWPFEDIHDILVPAKRETYNGYIVLARFTFAGKAVMAEKESEREPVRLLGFFCKHFKWAKEANDRNTVICLEAWRPLPHNVGFAIVVATRGPEIVEVIVIRTDVLGVDAPVEFQNGMRNLGQFYELPEGLTIRSSRKVAAGSVTVVVTKPAQTAPVITPQEVVEGLITKLSGQPILPGSKWAQVKEQLLAIVGGQAVPDLRDKPPAPPPPPPTFQQQLADAIKKCCKSESGTTWDEISKQLLAATDGKPIPAFTRPDLTPEIVKRLLTPLKAQTKLLPGLDWKKVECQLLAAAAGTEVPDLREKLPSFTEELEEVIDILKKGKVVPGSAWDELHPQLKAANEGTEIPTFARPEPQPAQVEETLPPPNWEKRRIEILQPITTRFGDGRWENVEGVSTRITHNANQQTGIYWVYRKPNQERRGSEDWGVIKDRPGAVAGLPLSEWNALTQGKTPAARWLPD